MGHDHEHHQQGTARNRLGLAFFLNASFTIVELVGASLTNSTAIAADALHDLGDSLALAFAWGMQALAGTRATGTFSYGFRRLSLVAALANAVVLIGGGALVLRESVPRLWSPDQPDAQGMFVLAVLGVAVNGAAVLRVGSGSTLNERTVTWHLLEDVLGWVAVLLVSVVMVFVDAPILDPLLSIAVTLFVGWNAGKHLKRTLMLFLQAVPDEIHPEELKIAALSIEGVEDLRHLHVWSLDGTNHILTGHLVVKSTTLLEARSIRQKVTSLLRESGIGHCTLEIDGTADASDAFHCST